ncbi:MAG: hypothetical protein HYY65_04650, partial [Candidatus Tectomicrobia bacterium]|nr:hypothetical protein [Candidatus Tectomicrobia bacterium]
MSSAGRSKSFAIDLRPIALVGASLVAIFWTALAGGQEGYREGTVANGATIVGETSFAGSPSGPFVVWVKKNADVFGEKLPDERVIVSPTGKVKNVLVTLEGIKKGKRWP